MISLITKKKIETYFVGVKRKRIVNKSKSQNIKKTSKKMTFTDVKKQLKQLEYDKLIELLGELYKKNKGVKEYLDFMIAPNEQELFAKYEDKVIQAFFPKRGDRLSLSDGKRAISDFKKTGVSAELVAELMLVYAESGVKFTKEYGDIDENFYYSVALVYHQALELMEKEGVLIKFKARAKKPLKITRNFGWGFYDDLKASFYEFYLNEDE